MAGSMPNHPSDGLQSTRPICYGQERVVSSSGMMLVSLSVLADALCISIDFWCCRDWLFLAKVNAILATSICFTLPASCLKGAANGRL